MNFNFKRKHATRKNLSNTPSNETKMQTQENLAHAISQFDIKRANIKSKQEEYRALRREVSRTAMIANKRIKRLEQQGFEFTQAYQAAFSGGNSSKFGVRGLQNENEVLAEMQRINNFLESKTSTITGVKKYLESLASSHGLEIKKGDYVEFKRKMSNLYRTFERFRQFDPQSVQLDSGQELTGLIDIIDQLDDGYDYSNDEIDVVIELALEEKQLKAEIEGMRRKAIFGATPQAFTTNKINTPNIDG